MQPRVVVVLIGGLWIGASACTDDRPPVGSDTGSESGLGTSGAMSTDTESSSGEPEPETDDETDDETDNELVWSNTRPNGTFDPDGDTCSGWTASGASAQVTAAAGTRPTPGGAAWSRVAPAAGCAASTASSSSRYEVLRGGRPVCCVNAVP